MYKCDNCGKKFADAYNRTLYFNGAPVIQTLCEECIKKIGHSEEGDSDGKEG